MVGVDLGELGHLFRIVAVMAEGMVPVWHAGFRIGARATLAAEHEGADPSEIGLHSQYLQIDHQSGIGGIGFRDAGRLGHRRQRGGVLRLCHLNATL